jgi:GTP-binding protein
MTEPEVVDRPRRIIAIVGRPNVGKSAFFNRLAGRRIAIVHEQSGVTRDRLMADVTWDNQPFEVIDTGGIGYMDGATPDGVIDQGIIHQVEAAIQDATILIFVVDISVGLLPLDQEVAKLLHASGRQVFLAANKSDNIELDADIVEFEGLGYPAFPISALHNRGVGEMMEEVLPCLPPAENLTVKNPLKVAIVGRPNAGKSSYINRLLRHERVIVSEVPGTTRDSIEIPFSVGTGEHAKHYQLIDTAGVRKRGKVKDLVEHFSVIRTERSIDRADIAILVLDAEEGPKDKDKKLAAMIRDKETGCILMINKWDLAEGITTQTKYGKALSEQLSFLNFAPVMFASSKSGYNIRKTIEAIDYVASQVSRELSTGVLNRVIHDATQRVAPPMVKGSRLKIYYCTQVGTKPVRIKFFCNNPKNATSAYKAYIMNQLRSKFGLEGAPIVMHFVARPKVELDPL